MTVADYLKYVDMDTFDSRKEVADSMIELGRTLGKENDWSELYFAGNKSVAARFCVDDRQLMKFLKGFYNSTDQEAVFDEKRCSVECLNKLAELGMDTRGKASIDSLSYTRLDTVFEQGQTLRNFNGHDYRVMESCQKEPAVNGHHDRQLCGGTGNRFICKASPWSRTHRGKQPDCD